MNPDHCAKYAKIRVFTDLYLSVWGPIRRFSPYMGEHEAVKTRILAYFMQCIVIVPERSHYTVGHLKMNQRCLCSNAPVVRKWKFKVIYVLNKGKDFETLRPKLLRIYRVREVYFLCYHSLNMKKTWNDFFVDERYAQPKCF